MLNTCPLQHCFFFHTFTFEFTIWLKLIVLLDIYSLETEKQPDFISNQSTQRLKQHTINDFWVFISLLFTKHSVPKTKLVELSYWPKNNGNTFSAPGFVHMLIPNMKYTIEKLAESIMSLFFTNETKT